MSAAQDMTGTPVRSHKTPGVYNLRDTGGYRAQGSSSRWGRLFRSDALHLLDDSGRELLTELRIAHIVDLRGSEERATAPSNVSGLNLTVHHLPVFDAAAPGSQLDIGGGLARIYNQIVDERGTSLVAAIRVIVEAAEDEAVLVHCTAGKDRTGLVIAFALSAVGVDREEVVADYAQTANNLRGEWAERMLARYRGEGGLLTTGTVEVITDSPAPVLSALLERVDRQYGSVRAYLEAHGMTADELSRLRATLVP